VEGDHEKAEVEMLKEAQTSLYEGFPISYLASILLMLNLVCTHGVRNAFMDELFTLLKVDLFFKDNTLLKLSYQAETIDQLLRLSYHAIHACYNSCIFKFKRGLSKAKACPKCQRSRFVEGSNIVPCKLLHHFPLIP